MSLLLKAFASGQLPSTKAALYTVPVIPTSSTVSLRVTLVNTYDDAGIKVNLYVNPAGTSRRVAPKDLVLSGGDCFVSNFESLAAGDTIEGVASVADVVDYVVSGLSRT